MVSPCQSRASGKLVCRVQTEADHRDPRRLEQRQKSGTDADSVLHRVLLIDTAAPEALQFRAPDDHGGIDSNRVRLQSNQLTCGVHRAVVVILRKSGHHLQHQREAGLMDHF